MLINHNATAPLTMRMTVNDQGSISSRPRANRHRMELEAKAASAAEVQKIVEGEDLSIFSGLDLSPAGLPDDQVGLDSHVLREKIVGVPDGLQQQLERLSPKFRRRLVYTTQGRRDKTVHIAVSETHDVHILRNPHPKIPCRLIHSQGDGIRHCEDKIREVFAVIESFESSVAVLLSKSRFNDPFVANGETVCSQGFFESLLPLPSNAHILRPGEVRKSFVSDTNSLFGRLECTPPLV